VINTFPGIEAIVLRLSLLFIAIFVWSGSAFAENFGIGLDGSYSQVDNGESETGYNASEKTVSIGLAGLYQPNTDWEAITRLAYTGIFYTDPNGLMYKSNYTDGLIRSQYELGFTLARSLYSADWFRILLGLNTMAYLSFDNRSENIYDTNNGTVTGTHDFKGWGVHIGMPLSVEFSLDPHWLVKISNPLVYWNWDNATYTNGSNTSTTSTQNVELVETDLSIAIVYFFSPEELVQSKWR
jgi:hypothetical protein